MTVYPADPWKTSSEATEREHTPSAAQANGQTFHDPPAHQQASGAAPQPATSLETMDFDGLGVQLEPFLLIHQELLHVLALVALQLDHLAHLAVVHNGAIAGELLLNDLEDLLLVEFLGKALDRGQGFATIALCSHADMD